MIVIGFTRGTSGAASATAELVPLLAPALCAGTNAGASGLRGLKDILRREGVKAVGVKEAGEQLTSRVVGASNFLLWQKVL